MSPRSQRALELALTTVCWILQVLSSIWATIGQSTFSTVIEWLTNETAFERMCLWPRSKPALVHFLIDLVVFYWGWSSVFRHHNYFMPFSWVNALSRAHFSQYAGKALGSLVLRPGNLRSTWVSCS
jgi:hypothetical protein